MVRSGVLLLVFLGGLISALFAGTAARADDRGYLQAFLEDNLSTAGRTVKIEGFQGALSSKASFDLLTIADDKGVWLTIRKAVLNWSRTALLTGQLKIDELAADEIILARIPASPPSQPSAATSPFKLPELPVSVDIAKLAVKKLTLGKPVLGEAASFSLDGNAHLAGGEGNAKLSLTRTDGPDAAFNLEGSFVNSTNVLTLALDVHEAAGGIVGKLIGLPGTPAFQLTLNGKGPLGDFHTDLTLATDGQPRVTGQFAMTDRPDPNSQGHTIRGFSATLTGDLRPLVAPEYHAFLGPKLDLTLDGDSYDDGRTVVKDFALNAEAMKLAGSFATDKTGWPVKASLTGNITPAAGDAVTLLLPGAPTQVKDGRIELNYDAATGNAWTLAAKLDGFSRPTMAISSVRIDGKGTLDPGTKRIAGTVTSSASGLDLKDEALNGALGSTIAFSSGFAWTSGKPLALSGLKLTGDNYGLDGDLSIAGADGSVDLGIDGKVTLTAQDFSRFAALAGQPISGSGKLTVNGSVAPISGGFDVNVTGNTTDLTTGIAQLDPLLAGTVNLDLSAKRGRSGIDVPRLSINGKGVSVSGKGALEKGKSNLDVRLSLDDAGRIAKGAKGPLDLTASAQESEGGKWTGKVAAQGPGGLDLAFDGSATLADKGVGAVEGKLTLAAKDLSPWADLAGRPLSGGLQAKIEGKGDVSAKTGSVTMTGTSQDLRTGMAEADAVLAGKGSYDIEVSRDASGKITIKTLSAKTPLVQVQANGSVAKGQGSVDYKLDVTDVSRLIAGFPGPAHASGSLKALKSGDFAVDTSLTAAGGTTAEVKGTLAQDYKTANLTVKGTAPLGYANQFISPNRTEGTAAFDLTLNGPLSAGSLAGDIRLSGVQLTAPTARFGVQGMAGTIHLENGAAQLNLSGKGSNGGRVTVTGSTGIVPPYTADLGAKLNRVIMSEPNLYRTNIDGDATLKGQLTGVASIGGSFTLNDTEVQIAELPTGSAGDVTGLTHVNESAASRLTLKRAGMIQEKQAPSKAWPLDISVDAPARIFVRGRGLDAELGGHLQLTGTTNAVVTQGRFTLIRGRLDFLGKRLTLNDATIRLQGDFNPYINATAVTQSGDTQITVTLDGPATSPNITFSSSPDLPQDEILSRLLFDKGITEVSALQALQIANALRTLSGQGGQGFTDKVRGKAGLDNLDVTSTATGQTEVTAGKYLNKNLYSDVTVDSAGKSRIDLNLSVTPNITTRGSFTSDGNSSVGVFYEKDY